MSQERPPAESNPRQPVSVVIPCHNSADTLLEQLGALAKQSFQGDWEVVVVDNLSIDHPEIVVAAFDGLVPGLRLVQATKLANPGYARNVGVERSVGRLVLFCDADDVVASDWVEQLVIALEGSPIVSGRVDFTTLNSDASAGSRGGQTAGLQSKFGFLPHGFSGNCGVWRDVHEAIGGFDVEIPSLEDADYFWRAQLAGFEASYAPNAIVHYRLRPDISGIFNQARRYASADVLLHKRYRSQGMEPLSLWSGMKGWIRLLLSLPLVGSSIGRAKFAWRFGYRVGRLHGAVTYRQLAI